MSSAKLRKLSAKERNRIIESLLTSDGQGALIIGDILTYTDVHSVVMCIGVEDADSFREIEVVESHMDDSCGGELIAQLVEHSSTIRLLTLNNNHFSEKTMYALARALFFNTSLVAFLFSQDQCSSIDLVLSAFVFALRLNPMRNPLSNWILLDDVIDEDVYPELKQRADQLGHPTMLQLLVHVHEPLSTRRRPYTTQNR